ncbi:50S ribosomal protein L9 [Olsenella sp. AF16-14LB]|jgi:large subunit ribosomal protein L9|uniref:50S ribosomal protein L9 n=1 Tax=Atopobiaceae TaxID=1643824 RepID=UPI0005094639|nr:MULTISPECIES: 50S ribosomal protein L9 [unclassified Olsenella]RGJ47021.1 50S ribosomal protein L9 [Olsenella sp. TM06-36]RGS50567.1 50S ribosomal protein L9 [Olsenella sp. AF21-51]RGU51139.1 50S ribosomal protein L9 [Olsenella sp. AF16-14LB]RGU82271.1 50S ribosomal protein L9 [Olsenella sp. AF15-43LB]RHB54625.1 50S ribosomal protein L9 [Olsenella sp. AM39-30AC]
MKVILLGELRGKGGEGDVVDVAQGYAENYLFRNKIAQPATPCNLKQLEQRRDSIAKREAERISNAEATKAVLDEKLVKVDAKIGEEGQLFGSVTSQQIVEAIKAQLGVDVDRKRIVRGATIKTAGRHAVEINLYRDINAKVVVLVGDEPVAEEPAAEEAAEPEATEAADEAAETTEAAE